MKRHNRIPLTFDNSQVPPAYIAPQQMDIAETVHSMQARIPLSAKRVAIWRKTGIRGPASTEIYFFGTMFRLPLKAIMSNEEGGSFSGVTPTKG
jgi:hypothetical protein